MANYTAAWLNDKTGEIHAPRSRMVYPTLLEPKRIKDKPDSKPKFGVTLLIPKAADISVLKNALIEALTGKFGKDWQKNKKLLMPLLKTADQERLADYAEAFPYILRASANEDYKPFLYGPDAKQFAGQATEIYSGRWAVVAGKFYAYDNVSKGASFGLNRLQLLEHDEPVAGGRVATSEGFEQVNVGAAESSGGKTAGSADDVFGDNDPLSL